MNEIDHIAALAAAADRSAPPTIDVADRVLAEILRGGGRAHPAGRRVWQATALATGALAVIAAIWAAQSASSLLNPLSDLGDPPYSPSSSPVSMEMQ